jgi:hypothetical protein
MGALKIRLLSDTLNRIANEENFFGAWVKTGIVRDGSGEAEARQVWIKHSLMPLNFYLETICLCLVSILANYNRVQIEERVCSR